MAIGLGLFVAPEPALRALGFSDVSPATKAVARIAGVRDFVLGGVTLAALDDGERLLSATARERDRGRGRRRGLRAGPRPGRAGRRAPRPGGGATRDRSPVYGWLAGSAELAARERRPRPYPASPGGLRHHIRRHQPRGAPFRRLRALRIAMIRASRGSGSSGRTAPSPRASSSGACSRPRVCRSRASAWTWTSPGFRSIATSDSGAPSGRRAAAAAGSGNAEPHDDRRQRPLQGRRAPARGGADARAGGGAQAQRGESASSSGWESTSRRPAT